ncbi:MAG: hypothetical protein SNJ74_09860, partial [Fimbriimonadaceae bacterium]
MTERLLSKWIVAGVCLGALLVAGCQPKPDPGSSAVPEKASSEAPAVGGTVEAAQDSAPARPALPLSKLPATAPAESLEYLGLKREEPLKMEVDADGQPTMTGTVTSRLIEVDGDKSVFEVERSGSLLGASRCSCRPARSPRSEISRCKPSCRLT